MNGKIDASGFLHIERAGALKYQECPFASDFQRTRSCAEWMEYDDIHKPCGDWCPLFGEPIMKAVYNDNGVFINNVPALQICQDRFLYFEVFTTERKNAD